MERNKPIQANKELNLKPTSVSAYAYAEEQNSYARLTMEDGRLIKDPFIDQGSGFFSLFDGHGGAQAMQFCQKTFSIELQNQMKKWPTNIDKAIEAAFLGIDKKLEQQQATEYGTTATVILVRQESFRTVMYCANVGDSRATLVTSDGRAIRISYEDKASDPQEQLRVEKAGGFILGNRTSGIIAITRALGDWMLKNQGLICTPHIIRRVIDVNDKFLIVATDGLWDVVQDSELPSLIQSCKSIADMPDKLIKTALERNSSDNVSVLVIQF